MEKGKVKRELERQILEKPGATKIKGKVNSTKFRSINVKFNGGKTIKLSSVLER